MHPSRSLSIKYNSLMLLAAIIWGFAFVAQKSGLDHIGPFTFNGARFVLGAFTLLPILLVRRNKGYTSYPPANIKKLAKYGVLAGIALFLGAAFQMEGILYTTAGKAGFVTGLYVVIVPLLGIFLGHKTGLNVWLGVLAALSGLYFLSIKSDLSMGWGDFLVLIGSFFWACHVILIDRFTKLVDSLSLAFSQFFFAALFNIIAAIFTETITVSSLVTAYIPILYVGCLSAGIAFTIQVVAQQHIPPANTAVILSLETAFAAIGGVLILAEVMSARDIFGCALMLGGMIISQINFGRKAS